MSMSKPTKRSWMGVAAAALVLAAVVAVAGWYAWPTESTGDGADAYTEEQLEKHRYAAEHYILSDEVPKARVILEKLLEHYPDDAEGRVLMAKVLMAEGKVAEAYREIHRSLEEDGARDEVQFLGGVLAYKIGELDRARYHYTQAAALAPGEAKYRLYLGQLLLKLDELDRAQTQLLKAHSMDSSLVQVYAMLAEISARRGKLNMALEQVNKALDQVKDEGDEDRRVKYTLLKALYLRRHNEPEAALRALWDLPAERHHEPRVVEHIAASYLMMSEPAKAAVTWSGLFDEEPTNATAAAEAGLCFLRAGDKNSARRYLGLAKRIDANEAKVRALEKAMAGEEG